MILNHIIKPADKSSVNTLPLIETKFTGVHFTDLTIHKFYLFLTSPTEFKTQSWMCLQQLIRCRMPQQDPLPKRASSAGTFWVKITTLELVATWELGTNHARMSCCLQKRQLDPGSQPLPTSQKWVKDSPLADVLAQAQALSQWSNPAAKSPSGAIIASREAGCTGLSGALTWTNKHSVTTPGWN